MRNLRFRELLMLSETETSARRVPFSPRLTVIKGANDTGKSSVLKSLYRTFGAEPAVVHQTWEHLNVISAVRFSLDERQFTILRHGNSFGIFGDEDKLIQSFTGVTKELSPYLAKFLRFRLRLATRANESIPPPPQYMFLPFYVDQDKGWADQWGSFQGLQQLPGGWKRPLLEYQAGLLTNEYLEASESLSQAKHSLQSAEEERSQLVSSRDRVTKHLSAPSPPIDLRQYEREIARLVCVVRELAALEEERLQAVVSIEEKLSIVREQIEIATAAFSELHADYAHATHHLDSTVECPTCGAEYNNSFAERFGLADDQARCAELIESLKLRRHDLERRLRQARPLHADTRAKYDAIQCVLREKRETIEFADVVRAQGRDEVHTLFAESIAPLDETIFELGKHIEDTKAQMKTLDDKDRKAEILGYYRSTVARYLAQLDVENIPETAYKRLDSKFRETGSDLPRALLARYFGLLSVIAQYGSSTFMPIVVDSPNQQDQDPESLRKMFSFVLRERPNDCQLILGTVDMYGVDDVDATIALDEKRRVLSRDDYGSVREELMPLILQVHD